MERTREVAHPRRHLVRSTRRGRIRRHVGIERQRAQQLGLPLVLQEGEVHRFERGAFDAGRGGAPLDRRDTRVRVLHVVNGILHRLRGDDVEVERLLRIDALQEKRHASDVGIDLVEDVGERDDVARALRDTHLGAVAHQPHELAEEHLGLGRRAEAERLHACLQRLDLPVVVGAPHVDEVVPAPPHLVAVVREVVAEIGRRAVRAHQHAVARVAEVGGAQPSRVVLVVDHAALLERAQHVGHLVALVQRALREPRVEVHADATEIVAQAIDDVPHTPLARVVGRHVVTQLLVQLGGHVDEVLPLVAVFRRCLAAVPGVQRVAEGRQLIAGVVQVVLAVHDRALRREQVGDRVAHCHPAPAARVQRSGRVGGDELEVDPLPRQVGRGAVRLAPCNDRAQHVVQPGWREIEVDEPGLGGLGPRQVRHRRVLERGGQLLGDLHRRPADRLGQGEGRGRGPVAVVTLLGQVDDHTARRLGEPRVRERTTHCEGEVVADHWKGRA